MIVNDVLVEEDVERFQATLTSNDSAVNVTEDKMCISILDDDGELYSLFYSHAHPCHTRIINFCRGCFVHRRGRPQLGGGRRRLCECVCECDPWVM